METGSKLYNIELISNDDIEEIINLYKLMCYDQEKDKKPYENLNSTLIKQMISTELTSIFKVSDMNQHIVAFMSLTESQSISSRGNYGIIDELFVIKAKRNENIEKMLVQKAKFMAQVKSWSHIQVTAKNEAMNQFCNSMAFEDLGRTFKI